MPCKYYVPEIDPPSEVRSFSVDVSYVCAQNNCGLCKYLNKKLLMRDFDDIYIDLLEIPDYLQQGVHHVFLAGGDALFHSQKSLIDILDELKRIYPNLSRVGINASPYSLEIKTINELKVLREKKLRILYVALESGDSKTLKLAGKEYGAEDMLSLCSKAHEAGMKLSVAAFLGLAGQYRSVEHATATADLINKLSPEYFSLLSMSCRHNDGAYNKKIRSLTKGQILEETLTFVRQLAPNRTILHYNHVSKFLQLAGSYPKDREKIIVQVESALEKAKKCPDWFNAVPDYLNKSSLIMNHTEDLPF